MSAGVAGQCPRGSLPQQTKQGERLGNTLNPANMSLSPVFSASC